MRAQCLVAQRTLNRIAIQFVLQTHEYISIFFAFILDDDASLNASYVSALFAVLCVQCLLADCAREYKNLC